MADNLLGRIICTNNSASSYNEDDIIQIYYSDTLNTIIVKLNDVAVTSGGAIFYNEYVADLGTLGYYNTKFDLNLLNTLKSNYQFCDGTGLVYFQLQESFPYFSQQLDVNSSECGGVACDILILGSPILTSPTSATGVDGQIKITAQSQAVIKFDKYNFDYSNQGFAADTVDGNVYTYTFTGLGVGEHKLFVKDSLGCTQERTVNLFFDDEDNIYNVKYFYSYTGRYGDVDLIRILEKDYVGSAEEIAVNAQDDETLTVDPLVYSRGKTGSDFFSGVDSSSVVIGIRSKVDNKFNDLYTQSEKKYLIEWYRNPADLNNPVSSELYFKGLNIPSLGEESYSATPYTSYFTFTDRLSDLNKYNFADEYEDSNNNYELVQTALQGQINVIEILSFCLKKLGISKNIRCGVNIFSEGMNTTSSDDPLFQTYVDVSTYYKGGNILKCSDVVDRILKPFQARLISWGNYYYIIRIPESLSTWNYREFTKNGVYVANGSHLNPYVDIKNASDSNRLIYMSDGNTRSNIQSYRRINLIINRDIAESLVNPFNDLYYNNELNSFAGWTKNNGSITGSWVTVIEDKTDEIKTYSLLQSHNPLQGSEAYISYTGKVEYSGDDGFILKLKYIIDTGFYTSLPNRFLRVKFQIKVGTKYLQKDGLWSTTESFLFFKAESYDQDQNFEISANFDVDVLASTTESFELKFYNVDPFESDVVGGLYSLGSPNLYSLIEDLDSSNYNVGDVIIGRATATSSTSEDIYYFEFREKNQDPDTLNIVPDDDSTKLWSMVENIAVKEGRIINDLGIKYKEIEFVTLPSGEELQETKINRLPVNNDNSIDLDFDLDHFDTDQTINNTERMVKNGFYLSDGSPTMSWRSAGESAGFTIQNVTYLNLSRLTNPSNQNGFRRSARKMNVKCKSNIDVLGFNTIRDTNDNNRLYYANQITWSVKDMIFNSQELVEIGSDTETIVKSHQDASHDSGHN